MQTDPIRGLGRSSNGGLKGIAPEFDRSRRYAGAGAPAGVTILAGAGAGAGYIWNSYFYLCQNWKSSTNKV